MDSHVIPTDAFPTQWPHWLVREDRGLISIRAAQVHLVSPPGDYCSDFPVGTWGEILRGYLTGLPDALHWPILYQCDGVKRYLKWSHTPIVAPTWQATTQTLPPGARKCLVMVHTFHHPRAAWWMPGQGWDVDGGPYGPDAQVTHWLTMPRTPQVKDAGRHYRSLD